jgi:hypothetical protein
MPRELQERQKEAKRALTMSCSPTDGDTVLPSGFGAFGSTGGSVKKICENKSLMSDKKNPCTHFQVLIQTRP